MNQLRDEYKINDIFYTKYRFTVFILTILLSNGQYVTYDLDISFLFLLLQVIKTYRG